jgi:hypothetical protein
MPFLNRPQIFVVRLKTLAFFRGDSADPEVAVLVCTEIEPVFEFSGENKLTSWACAESEAEGCHFGFNLPTPTTM